MQKEQENKSFPPIFTVLLIWIARWNQVKLLTRKMVTRGDNRVLRDGRVPFARVWHVSMRVE